MIIRKTTSMVPATKPAPMASASITGRKYPDGESIPDSLPGKYRTSERCDNCAAYVPSTSFCVAWKAIVRPEYVCAGWAPIQKV